MYIKVEIILNQKKEKIEKVDSDRYLISINAKAQRGEANKRLIQILNSHFDNPRGGVKIINGHRTRVKLLKIGNE